MDTSIATTNTAGTAIDRLSREQGRTKWWVAKELGTHPSHLSKLISGERAITPRVAARLAEIFGVPAQTFLVAPTTEEEA